MWFFSCISKIWAPAPSIMLPRKLKIITSDNGIFNNMNSYITCIPQYINHELRQDFLFFFDLSHHDSIHRIKLSKKFLYSIKFSFSETKKRNLKKPSTCASKIYSESWYTKEDYQRKCLCICKIFENH